MKSLIALSSLANNRIRSNVSSNLFLTNVALRRLSAPLHCVGISSLRDLSENVLVDIPAGLMRNQARLDTLFVA